MRYLLRILGSLFILGAGHAHAQTPAWHAPLAAKFASSQSPQTLSVLIELRAPDLPQPNPVPPESAERERATAAQVRDVAAQAQRIAAEASAPFVQDMRAAGLAIRNVYAHQPIVLADVRREDLATLAVREDVAAVYENTYIMLPPLLPTATTQPQQDGPERPLLDKTTKYINADAAWARGYRGQGYSVAILDTGFSGTHEMLRGRIAAEACFSDPTLLSFIQSLCPERKKSVIGPGSATLCPGAKANTRGPCEHGTHVAGIALGDNNSTTNRLRGVAPEAKLVAVQVFSNDKNCDTCLGAYTSDILAGLDWVAGVADTYSIVAANLSLGTTEVFGGNCTGRVLENAIKVLRKMNVLTVIAAGNGGYRGALSDPGCIRDAFTVGSINLAGNASYFSNTASTLDLFAPGENVKSAIYGDTAAYAMYSGTSMSTPHAAGAVAVLKSKLPTATAAQLEYAMQGSSPRVTRDDWTWTTPRLDLNAALDVLGIDPPPPGVTMAGLFPGDRQDMRSVLRLVNLSYAAFDVPVTVVQDTPRLVLGTYKMNLKINGSAQASVRDMESAIRAQSLPTSLVSVTLNPPREIYAQHVVIDNATQAVSNLTLCTSDKPDPGNVMTYVHTQTQTNRISYITITNKSALPITPYFNLYEAGSGTAVSSTDLGSAYGPTINGNSTVRFPAQTLFDKARMLGRPPGIAAQVSYVNVRAIDFTGVMRHHIEHTDARIMSDMTTKCPI